MLHNNTEFQRVLLIMSVISIFHKTVMPHHNVAEILFGVDLREENRKQAKL